MGEERKHIFEIYRTEQEAIDAVDRMAEAGYNRNEISIISRYEGKVGAAAEKMDDAVENPQASEKVNQAELFTQAGLFAHGGTVGLPGIGPAIAAGPIAASLKDGVNEEDHDRLFNTLTDMGLPEKEARNCENDIREGRFVVLLEQR